MSLSIIIMAAGRGSRMKSELPKVLHHAMGKPMLQYAIDAVKPLKPSKLVVVIGNGAELVKDQVQDKSITFVEQKELLGTGDAVATAMRHIKKGTVLVMNGDCPLITSKSLKQFLARHKRSKNDLSLLSFIDPEMSGYGRIFRDDAGNVTEIVEDKHATAEERKIFTELNGGIYLISSDVLSYLDKVKLNRASGEYYLTDLVEIAAKRKRKLNAYTCPAEEVRGVNSRRELYEVSDILRKKTIAALMDRGVTFIDPNSCIIHGGLKVGRDTVIYPNTYLEGNTTIGKNCIIFPGSRITDSTLGNGVIVKDNTLIEESSIGNEASIGPCAHIRPASMIGNKAKIGNFVETKKCVIGEGSKASHLTYLGDAVIGRDVNIGAGTITCNYDGTNKFLTTIEDGVFIGSDSQLVAPVKIGKGSYVGAGSTVTEDIPAGSLALSRSKQTNIEGWADKKKKKLKSVSKKSITKQNLK